MWPYGFAGLVIGLPLLIVAAHFRDHWFAIRDVKTFSCARLGEAAREAAGATFQQPAEVCGSASLTRPGPLRAPGSGAECLWYRNRVTERYWDYERDSRGRRARKKRSRILSQDDSPEPIRVEDGTGAILVHARGAEVDGAEKTGDRVEVVRAGTRDSLRHEEWIIPPGVRLYVLGVAAARGGELSLEPPGNLAMLISTRSEAAFLSRERAKALLFGVPALVLVAGGMLVMLLDIFI